VAPKRRLPPDVAAFVYVLLSTQKPKRTYVGWTLDLERRIEQHNAGSGARTTRGGQWILVYAERYRTRNVAMRREVFLKRDRRFRALLREL
jgi:putative endonuclease